MNTITNRFGNKKISILVGIAVFFVLYVVGVILGTPHTSSLEELNWDKVPSVLSISPIERDGYTGTLFIRLSDGLEQFIPGEWQTSFSEQGNVYIYGSYPDDYPIDKKKKLYEIVQSEDILDIDLLNTDGEIRSVQENAPGTYILVKIEKNSTTYFCIAERIGETVSECDELNLYGDGTALWDPEKDHEVVLKNAAGEILTYDPWSPGLNQVKQNEDAERFSRLTYLLDGQKKSVADTQLYHVLHWIIGKVNNQLFIQTVPLQSGIKLLTDQKHVLVVGTEKVEIIELDTSKKVIVYTNANLVEKEVKFRGSFGEEYL